MEAPDNGPPDEPIDDRFADLLEAFDEALAAGRTVDLRGAAATPGDIGPRLEEAVVCLPLLEARGPRARGSEATLPEDGGRVGEVEGEPFPARVGRYELR